MSKISTTIISNIDPFSESFSFADDNSNSTLPEARWRALWGSFGITYFHSETKKTEHNQKGGNSEQLGHDKKLLEWVDSECQWTPVLYSLGKTYLAYAQNETTTIKTPHTEATVTRAILQLARAYYEEIWQSLTSPEQLALFHLAKDRFIHFEHPGLEPLIRKGLLRFGPDLCLLNASFREFVLIVGERDQIRDDEAKLGNSLWEKLKWPFGLGFGTILLVLMVTQEELRAALPAVIALAPVLFRGLPELSGKTKV